MSEHFWKVLMLISQYLHVAQKTKRFRNEPEMND